jgi:hypothetical protein
MLNNGAITMANIEEVNTKQRIDPLGTQSGLLTSRGSDDPLTR